MHLGLLNVPTRILSSISVPIRTTMVQMPNLALIETKRITMAFQCLTVSELYHYKCNFCMFQLRGCTTCSEARCCLCTMPRQWLATWLPSLLTNRHSYPSLLNLIFSLFYASILTEKTRLFLLTKVSKQLTFLDVFDLQSLRKNIEWFIEDQAFSPSYDLPSLPPPPPRLVGKLDRRHTG